MRVLRISLPSPFKFPSPLGEGLGVRPGLGVRLPYGSGSGLLSADSRFSSSAHLKLAF